MPPDLVDTRWEEVSVLLKKAVDQSCGAHDMDALYEEIKSGEHDLWIIFTGEDNIVAAYTTQICKYPRKTSLVVTFCGSDDKMGGLAGVWIEAMCELKKWAVSYGFDAIEIVGRRGWTRVFRPMGFKETHVITELDLRGDSNG
jgi:hypothetical protein